MKKVGIMSMQRIKNYGSFLQAYGLKKNVENLGYDVEFVDYEYEKTIRTPKRKNIFLKVISNINVLQYIKKKKILKQYDDLFEQKFTTLDQKI